jgi:hypothetical protein
MIDPQRSRRTLLWVVIAAGCAAFAFAAYTQHAWEDYYITYRVSKNLATGHGLVYNVGDRLHTFTSPLGVLLPALASLLTGNSSDAVALWLFRIMSISAFATTAGLLFTITRRLGYPIFAGVCVVGWLVADAKSLDFAINGMETAFMALFFSYGFWAMSAVAPRRWLHLGLAWGGLMWTRPDAFIYIVLFWGGLWLFRDSRTPLVTRADKFKLFVRAGAVAAAVYLPWFIFAWIYYGSPVPHTIIAKAGIAAPKTLAGFLGFLLHGHRLIWSPLGTLESVFMPAYVIYGGWPETLRFSGRILAEICSLLWLVPKLRPETRSASLAFLLANLYLSYFPPFPFPWYLCLPALLAFIALGGALAEAFRYAGSVSRLNAGAALRCGLAVLALGLLGMESLLTWHSANQLKVQQTLVENGTRRKIGEWLAENAGPRDTVFLESLGYIGYFSHLKTFDFPGLSSREVVNAMHRVGPDWGNLIKDLQPDWLVLRPHEIAEVTKSQPTMLKVAYEGQRVFNVLPLVKQASVYGREYLEYDSIFVVFKKRAKTP